MKRITKRRVTSADLLLLGALLLNLGGCLPENYWGNLFTRLTTNAADFAVQTVLSTAVDAILGEPAAPATETPAAT
jgi:hypothetical protein